MSTVGGWALLGGIQQEWIPRGGNLRHWWTQPPSQLLPVVNGRRRERAFTALFLTDVNNAFVQG